MRSFKHIAISIVLTFSIFGAVLYTSCVKSGCKGVTCLNTGACSGGLCSCPSGVGGNNCETVYRLLYANKSYRGTATYNFSDSNYIIRTDTGNTITFISGNDSNFTRMQLGWNRPGQSGTSTLITLSNNSASGSNFTLDQFPIDTFVCTGSGSVNANTVSLNITATPPHSHPVTITLANFTRQ